jgi:hypothetical protein
LRTGSLARRRDYHFVNKLLTDSVGFRQEERLVIPFEDVAWKIISVTNQIVKYNSVCLLLGNSPASEVSEHSVPSSQAGRRV